MKKIIPAFLTTLIFFTTGICQNNIKLQVFAGLDNKTTGLQYNPNMANHQFDFKNIAINQNYRYNAGVLADYSLNENQSLRSGLWYFPLGYELQAFVLGSRVENLSLKRDLHLIIVPILYSHTVFTSEKWNCRFNMNTGTSLDLIFTPELNETSTFSFENDVLVLQEKGLISKKTTAFPVLIGGEFQFFNSKGKDGLFLGINRRYSSGMTSQVTYSNKNKEAHYILYNILSFTSFKVGYTFSK
jgi:hypothetical protein